MNMIGKNSNFAAAPIDGDDVLRVLNRRLIELDQRDQQLLKQQIELEKTAGAASRSDLAAADAAQAEALLFGTEFVATRERPMPQLALIQAEREVIARALKLGRSRQHQLETERAGRIWEANYPKIAEIEKRRVFLALELQKVNRARETLRAEINAQGGAGFLSTDSADLLGLGDIHDEVMWAAERLIADGIATKAELKRSKI